jgi:hypothetical protein
MIFGLGVVNIVARVLDSPFDIKAAPRSGPRYILGDVSGLEIQRRCSPFGGCRDARATLDYRQTTFLLS